MTDATGVPYGRRWRLGDTELVSLGPDEQGQAMFLDRNFERIIVLDPSQLVSMDPTPEDEELFLQGEMGRLGFIWESEHVGIGRYSVSMVNFTPGNEWMVRSIGPDFRTAFIRAAQAVRKVVAL